MKKLTTIFGIGAISMAVALAPAFAQQVKPQDTTAPAATIQPKASDKAPAPTNPAGKDEKNLSVKPGDTKAEQTTHAKPGAEAKEIARSQAKASADVKNEKATPSKPGTDVKSEAVPAKPSTDVKTDKGVTSKPETTVKNESAPAKPAGDVKKQ